MNQRHEFPPSLSPLPALDFYTTVSLQRFAVPPDQTSWPNTVLEARGAGVSAAGVIPNPLPFRCSSQGTTSTMMNTRAEFTTEESSSRPRRAPPRRAPSPPTTPPAVEHHSGSKDEASLADGPSAARHDHRALQEYMDYVQTADARGRAVSNVLQQLLGEKRMLEALYSPAAPRGPSSSSSLSSFLFAMRQSTGTGTARLGREGSKDAEGSVGWNLNRYPPAYDHPNALGLLPFPSPRSKTSTATILHAASPLFSRSGAMDGVRAGAEHPSVAANRHNSNLHPSDWSHWLTRSDDRAGTAPQSHHSTAITSSKSKSNSRPRPRRGVSARSTSLRPPSPPPPSPRPSLSPPRARVRRFLPSPSPRQASSSSSSSSYGPRRKDFSYGHHHHYSPSPLPSPPSPLRPFPLGGLAAPKEDDDDDDVNQHTDPVHSERRNTAVTTTTGARMLSASRSNHPSLLPPTNAESSTSSSSSSSSPPLLSLPPSPETKDLDKPEEQPSSGLHRVVVPGKNSLEMMGEETEENDEKTSVAPSQRAVASQTDPEEPHDEEAGGGRNAVLNTVAVPVPEPVPALTVGPETPSHSRRLASSTSSSALHALRLKLDMQHSLERLRGEGFSVCFVMDEDDAARERQQQGGSAVHLLLSSDGSHLILTPLPPTTPVSSPVPQRAAAAGRLGSRSVPSVFQRSTTAPNITRSSDSHIPGAFCRSPVVLAKDRSTSGRRGRTVHRRRMPGAPPLTPHRSSTPIPMFKTGQDHLYRQHPQGKLSPRSVSSPVVRRQSMLLTRSGLPSADPAAPLFAGRGKLVPPPAGRAFSADLSTSPSMHDTSPRIPEAKQMTRLDLSSPRSTPRRSGASAVVDFSIATTTSAETTRNEMTNNALPASKGSVHLPTTRRVCPAANVALKVPAMVCGRRQSSGGSPPPPPRPSPSSSFSSAPLVSPPLPSSSGKRIMVTPIAVPSGAQLCGPASPARAPVQRFLKGPGRRTASSPHFTRITSATPSSAGVGQALYTCMHHHQHQHQHPPPQRYFAKDDPESRWRLPFRTVTQFHQRIVPYYLLLLRNAYLLVPDGVSTRKPSRALSTDTTAATGVTASIGVGQNNILRSQHGDLDERCRDGMPPQRETEEDEEQEKERGDVGGVLCGRNAIQRLRWSGYHFPAPLLPWTACNGVTGGTRSTTSTNGTGKMTRMRYMLYVWLPESQKRQASTDLNAIHELALRSVWSTNRPTPLLLLPGDGDTVHRDTRVDVPSFPDNHKRSPTPSFSTLPPPRRPESSSTLLSGSAKASASAFSSSPLSPSSSRAADRGVRRSGEKPASSSQTLPRFSRMPCSLYAIEFSCRADWVDFVVGVQAAVFSEPMLTRGRALWMLAATRVLQRCGSRSSPVSAQGPMSDPNGTSFPMDHAGSQVTKTSSVPTRATDDNVSVSDGEAVRFRGLPREMERLKNGSSRLERFHWQGQESVADQRRQQTDPPPPPSPSPPPPPSSHASSPPATPLLTLSSALTRMSCVSTFRPMPAPDTTHEAGLMSAEASFPIVRAEADGGLDGDKGYPTSRSLETASLPAPQQIIALAPSPRFALRDHASREMDQWEEDPKKGCSTSPLHRRFAVPQ